MGRYDNAGWSLIIYAAAVAAKLRKPRFTPWFFHFGAHARKNATSSQSINGNLLLTLCAGHKAQAILAKIDSTRSTSQIHVSSGDHIIPLRYQAENPGAPLLVLTMKQTGWSMSAASQRPHSSLRETTKIGNEKANIEPSMEEILASIRRIIADDQAHLTPLSIADTTSEMPTPQVNSITFETGVFEETIVTQDAPPAAPSKIEEPASKPAPKTARVQSTSSSAPEAKPKVEKPAKEQAEEPLLSSAAGASAISAFESLSSVVVNRSTRTMEDLVQDMLRPLLKTWLDENLPPLVEKLVRAEIERISRGNR